MDNPTYGLPMSYRPYRCDCCGDVHDVQTNHTGPCYPQCPACSWRSAYDSNGNYYRADIGKNRPHYYAGAVEQTAPDAMTYWLAWKQENGHSVVPATPYVTRGAREVARNDKSLWPGNHTPGNAWETINGKVI